MSTFLHLLNSKVIVQNFNNDFLLLKAENESATASIGKAIFKQQFDFVDEVIVTETEICLKLNIRFEASKIEQLTEIEIEEKTNNQLYKLPVWFRDHEDWLEIEKVSGFNKTGIIAKLCESDFSIAMFGFLPGFMYINGLDESLQVPRKKVPSKYVEANSIAIGGKYLGLYALDSPGGWYVIGKTPVSVLQIPQVPPVVLNLGDRIQLESITEQKFQDVLHSKTTLKNYNA